MIQAVVFVLVFVLSAFAIQAQKAADFSGKWTLDVANSKLGERNMIEAQTLTVTQTTGEIKIETATKRAAPPTGGPGGGGRGMGVGDMPVTYALDGKETKTERSGPNGAIPVLLKAKVEGSKLMLSQSMTFSTPNGEMTSTTKETWELGADGKSLTVITERTSMRGAETTTRVFVKG